MSVFNSLFADADVRAGGAFLAGGPVGPCIGAFAGATGAAAPGATEAARAGHAGVRTGGAVAVLPRPAGVTLARAAQALSMTWDTVHTQNT